MATSSKPDEGPPPGTEYARDFYNEWDFVEHAVCLYSHGISWKGGAIRGTKADDGENLCLLDIPQKFLLEAAPRWFVDGRVVVLPRDSDPPSLEVCNDGEEGVTVMTVRESFGEPAGRSLLWPACANHPAIGQMRDVPRPNDTAESMLTFMLDDARRSLHLPQWAYDPEQASHVNMWAVASGLEDYRLTVDRYRENLLRGTLDALQGWLSHHWPQVSDPALLWGGDWRPSESMGGWEGVYWAFQQCGVPLTKFGEEFPGWLRQMEGAGLPVPPGALRAWGELGL